MSVWEMSVGTMQKLWLLIVVCVVAGVWLSLLERREAASRSTGEWPSDV